MAEYCMVTSDLTYTTSWYPQNFPVEVQEDKAPDQISFNVLKKRWFERFEFFVHKSSVIFDLKNALEQAKILGMIIPRTKLVEGYLLNHIGVIPVLNQILQVIFQNLSSADQLILDLYQDPEFDEEFLVIYARQREYQDDFIEQVERAREEYQKQYPSITDIFLTTDFQPPVEYV